MVQVYYKSAMRAFYDAKAGLKKLRVDVAKESRFCRPSSIAFFQARRDRARSSLLHINPANGEIVDR